MRTLVPKTVAVWFFGTRSLMYWVLGLPGPKVQVDPEPDSSKYMNNSYCWGLKHLYLALRKQELNETIRMSKEDLR